MDYPTQILGNYSVNIQKDEHRKWKNYESAFPSYLRTKLKCSRLAKINSTLKKDQENYENKTEKLEYDYNNISNIVEQKSSELKTVLTCIQYKNFSDRREIELL